tara:strand:- start:761 stop:1201 length:441 start_codon:yes stop_codon:yes gene_type:complete
MAGIRASDLTSAIVEGVSKSLAKILLPKVRKMIREEIERGMSQMIVEAAPQNNTASSTQAAKETIAQRQARARDRARQIVERNGMTGDPLMDMVINAEDQQEEQALQMQYQLEAPMVESKQVQPGAEAVDPSQIDFSDRLEKLGIE